MGPVFPYSILATIPRPVHCLLMETTLVISAQPLYNAVRFLLATVVALMLWSMFWNLGSKTKRQQDLFNEMGSLYAAVLFLGIQNAVLHILRHDDCGCDAKPSYCCDCFLCILFNVEPLSRIHHPTAGGLDLVWIDCITVWRSERSAR
ncbi:ABC transporter G family member 44-like [Malus sylvestris]|uniref:ABC transporter G family member 44-like n=1 Tax=Malus sylvestris TaxID=3752 RepID=UPI0021ABB9BF|nr:ABC transporter G family member 44-like [Malus sylvestris]